MIVAAAANEAAEAIAWYETERSGLGAKFDDAINSALDLLEQELIPLAAWPGAAGHRGVKHLVLRRFPFSIIVHEEAERFLVLAIAHHGRHPGYWVSRLST